MNLLLDYRPALRDRTGVGEWVHQLALNLLRLKADGDPAAAGVGLTLWSSSWRDRPTPSALREPSSSMLAATISRPQVSS